MNCRSRLFVLAAALLLAHRPAPAQNLDLLGVTALRAVTTNLNGAGIRVAQPEAGYDQLTNWEVNPLVVGKAPGFLTYVSAAGSTTNFPNALSSESGHADNVGKLFYGTASGVATNVAHVDNYDADYFVNYYVISNLAALAGKVANQSFTFSEQSVANQQAIDSAYDNYTAQHQTLFVSAANNYGVYNPPASYSTTNVVPPGTSYNCISVGAYANGTFANALGPTIDNGRCKPDITAPAGQTSDATPQVSGAAAVLLQAALRGDGGSDTNAAADIRTIKTLLLNGAVKPADWTNSSSSPLDFRYGAGMVNLFNAYEQLAGKRQSNYVATAVALNGNHFPPGATNTIPALGGWDFGTNTSSPSADAIRHYCFNVTNGNSGAKFTATATLVWQRHLNKTNINNLDLFLYDCANSNLVLCSTSLVDNVEHIYTNGLPPGRYDLQVWKAGGSTVTTNEGYALAWAFTPPPVLAITGGTNAALTWPLYPAGFLVEAETNLSAPAWGTNNLSTNFINANGLNSTLLNKTNAAQFFRLRSPNF